MSKHNPYSAVDANFERLALKYVLSLLASFLRVFREHFLFVWLRLHFFLRPQSLH